MNKSSRLFRLTAGGSTQLIKEVPFKREKDLQDLIERNLHRLLDIDYVANKRHLPDSSLQDVRRKLLPDTLGITKDLRPAIIEYKKTRNASVTSQIVTYADNLNSYQEKFLSLLHDTKGFKSIKHDQVLWKRMRLVGIAPEFSRYELVNAKKNGVELVTYKLFDNHTILLNWIEGRDTSKYKEEEQEVPIPLELPPGEVGKRLWKCTEEMKKLYFKIFGSFTGLGKNISPNYTPKNYIGFNKDKRGVGSIGKPAIKKGFFKVHLNLNPANEQLEEGFTRDMRGRGLHGLGKLEVTIKNSRDLDKALPLFRKAYKEN